MGRADAPVVITEFSDFQCPACGYVAREVIPELIKRYVDTGKVRFVYREFPLSSIHPAAQKASEAALCAGDQDKYWEMNEHLFANQEEWSAEGVAPTDVFKQYAQELGLDVKAFGQCLDSGRMAITIQEDQMAGQMAGVQATPTFFVNGLPIEGGRPIDTFGLIIDYVAAGGPPPEIIPEPDDWHMRGNPQAARAIAVAFVDYASADSARHAREVLPELVKTYINTGQLIYILHPWAEGTESLSAQAAAAAECAGQQGKFWEMHDQLFAQQDAWLQATNPQDSFADYAASLQLDADRFEECLGSDWARLRVQSGHVIGALYGVPGAPAFLFNNGQGREGNPSLDEFKAVIDSILNP
ncbi:MAG: DsbA family protein [Anaerolineae bacterium]